MDNDTLISTLNGLIETCKDGEQGFRTAAEGLTDPQTKSEFQNYSRRDRIVATGVAIAESPGMHYVSR
jgi:hypothetical protein